MQDNNTDIADLDLDIADLVDIDLVDLDLAIDGIARAFACSCPGCELTGRPVDTGCYGGAR